MKAITMSAQGPVDEDGDPAAQPRIDDIVEGGPAGAYAVGGVAVGVVIALWFAFYFFVYLPRGAVQ